MNANDIKKGTNLVHDGQLYEVLDYQHTKPGKGGAFMKTKMKNMKSGTIIEHTFRAQEKVEEAYIEKRDMAFCYKDGPLFYFMDENYEQHPVEEAKVEEVVDFLKEDQDCNLWYHDGELLRVILPESVVLKIDKTEPGVKGDTASSATKPATLETGFVVQVPLFIEEGETIKIDTRTGKYIERVNE